MTNLNQLCTIEEETSIDVSCPGMVTPKVFVDNVEVAVAGGGGGGGGEFFDFLGKKDGTPVVFLPLGLKS